MNNADKFKQIFDLYATELWAMSEKDFCAWLNAERDVSDTNVGDLISKEAAYDTLTKYYHHKTETQHESLKEALSRVPTIDPVKHGKWIERKKCRTTKDGAFHTYRFKVCSECGRASGRRMNRPTHYCPNCGAKMESE